MSIVYNDANKQTQANLAATTVDVTNVVFAPGSERVGICLVAWEDTGTTATLDTVQIDPGGSDEASFVAGSNVNVDATNSNGSAIFYLPESLIPGSAKTVRLTFSQAINSIRVVIGITATGVDQVNLPGSTISKSSVAADTAITENLTISADSIVFNVISADTGTGEPAQDGTQTLIEANSEAAFDNGFAYEIEPTGGSQAFGWTYGSNSRKIMALVEFQESLGQSVQVQLRRGLDSAISSFVGAQGELAWNITNKRLHGQDALTSGGIIIPNASDLYKQSFLFDQPGGTSNAITLTLPDVPAAYTDGMIVYWQQAGDNTAATTININSLGVKNVVGNDGGVLVGGELLDDGIFAAVYDLTNDEFKLLGGTQVKSSWEFLQRTDITSTVSEIDFTGPWTNYDVIKCIGTSIELSTTADERVRVRISTDGGSTFDSTVGNYAYADGTGRDSSANALTGNSASEDAFFMSSWLTNASTGTELMNFEFNIATPSEVNQHFAWWTYTAQKDPSVTVAHNTGGGVYFPGTSVDVDALRFFLGSGSITDGHMTLMGLRKT